jgi:hypothetical protein
MTNGDRKMETTPMHYIISLEYFKRNPISAVSIIVPKTKQDNPSYGVILQLLGLLPVKYRSTYQLDTTLMLLDFKYAELTGLHVSACSLPALLRYSSHEYREYIYFANNVYTGLRTQPLRSL